MAATMASPSQAADINFDPEGNQLDGDAILDILLEPGQPITFTNTFENTGDFVIGVIPRPTLFIEYLVTFDPQELQYTGSQLDFNNFISNTCILPGNCGSTIDLANVGSGQLTVRHQTGVANSLVPPNQFELDRISFIGLNVNNFPGDGLPDYSLAGFNSGFGGIFGVQISSFTSSSVEVQGVPGPLPLLGLGAAFGASRRLRRRLNSTQVSSSN